MSGWITTDLAGLRANSSLAKVIREMAQNALDTNAYEISITIEPSGKGRGRVVVIDNDPIGYVNLSDAYTLFAPSTKATDDTKRGLFNMGEKEFLAFCIEGRIVTMSGAVTFNADGSRARTTKAKTDIGSRHEFVLRMNREDQAEMTAALREIIIDSTQRLTINGTDLVPRPAMLETSATLPLFVAHEDRFVTRERITRITLHEPGTTGPMLHVIGMPVQPIECPYSVNVHGRLKMDHARDQVAAPTVAKILAHVTNALAERDALSDDDARGWAGATLGRHTTPLATKAIITGRFGADAVVASPTNHGANADAASTGRAVIYGGALPPEAWDAVKRSRAVYTDLAQPSTVEFGAGIDGALDEPIPEHLWPDTAKRVVIWTRLAAKVCFPNDDITVTITGGNNAKGCIAAATRGSLIFNQGHVGWDWFDPSNLQEIVATVVHELGHHKAHQAEHSYAWGDACAQIAARLMLNTDALEEARP